MAVLLFTQKAKPPPVEPQLDTDPPEVAEVVMANLLVMLRVTLRQIAKTDTASGRSIVEREVADAFGIEDDGA